MHADLDEIAAPRPPGALVRARLVVEILATYAVVRWRLRTANLPEVVRALRDVGPVDELNPGRAAVVGPRLRRPALRILRALPLDSRCLVRSLVLLRLMARVGVPCDLVIGARIESGFAAHAWLEYAGTPVLPTHGYERLALL